MALGLLLDGLWGPCSAVWVVHSSSWLAPGWSFGPKRALARRPVWPGPHAPTRPVSEKLILTPALGALAIRKRGQDHIEEGKALQGELRTTTGKREEYVV